ncbi:MAG: D-cysteine desulfhydrase [Negativicutes bacterium]
MNLAKFKRRRYVEVPTPIQYLPRFSTALGGPGIYMKRDDLLMGLAAGGNKTRKLEFLAADALTQGADTLITCGAVQSNHCRLTLAAAVKEGINCRLVLQERVPGSYKIDASGNNLLFHLLGVEEVTVISNDTDRTAVMEDVAKMVKSLGRKAYIIPAGGSTPLGAMGYVACAEEILAQSFDRGVQFSHVVTTTGSGGTQAGLIVGFQGNNAHIPVIGINCSRAKEPQETQVYNIVEQTRILAGVDTPISRDAVLCMDEYVGPGYSLPTPEMVEAVKLMAKTEGILLDPVYTGKAMAGLIGLIRKGYFKTDDNVLFVHTGGSPALYAYTQHFTN